MSKKMLKLLGILIVVSGLLVSQVAIAFAATEIDYWTGQTQEERMAMYRDLAEEFEEETGYKVNIIPYGEQQGFATKYQAAKMADDLPQVIETDSPFTTLKLISEEVAISELAETVINDLGEDDFFDFFLTLVSYEDKRWGVPYLCFLNGVYFRKDWFEENGIEPFTEPITYDQLLNAAKKLHNPKERKYGIAIGTAKVWYTFQSFAHVARAAGARIFDKEGNVVVNSEEMVRALEFYKELAQYTMPGAVASGDSFKSYTTGNAAMTDLASYLISYIEDADPELGPKTGYVYKIKDKEVSSYPSASSLMAIKGMSEEQKKASIEWMKWLMTGERRTNFLHLVPGGFNPVRKSTLHSDEYLASEVYQRWGTDTFIKIVEGAEEGTLFGWFDDGTVIPEIGDIAKAQVIQGAIYDMTEKNIAPEEIAERLEKDIKEVLGY